MSFTGKICRVSDPAPLEDELAYVLRKAMRGMGKSNTQLAAECGMSLEMLDACMRGKGTEAGLTSIAQVLALSVSAVLGHANYHPTAPIIQGITRLELPFDADTVNAWLLRVEDHSLLFDTGYLPDSALRLLQTWGAADLHLMLTHDHRDHVGGVAALAPLVRNQWQIPMGQEVSFGPLRVRSIDLAGHCIPTSGYVIDGLSRAICVTGDALFAGSIGGCADPFTYQMALRNCRQHIFSLPDDTLLLPGHGPATTVGQERICNPFFA